MSYENYEEQFGNITLDRTKIRYNDRPSFWEYVAQEIPSYDDESEKQASLRIDAALESVGVILHKKARELYNLETKVLILCHVLKMNNENACE
jgi:hypothetical protein